MTIYPAILTESITELSEQLGIIQEHAEVAVAHIDVVDGFFADALTVTPIDLNEVDLEELKVDLHLITNEPLDFVYEAISGLDPSLIRAVIGQVEQMSWQSEFITEVKKQGWKAGLSLNLYTPVDEIAQESWQQLDVIQVMGIEAGAQGLHFNPIVLEKITEIKRIIQNLDQKPEIIIDGGIKQFHIPEISKAGVDAVTIGSDIWTDSDPSAKLSELLKVA